MMTAPGVYRVSRAVDPIGWRCRLSWGAARYSLSGRNRLTDRPGKKGSTEVKV